MLGHYVASTVSIIIVPQRFAEHRQRRWTAVRSQDVPFQWRNHAVLAEFGDGAGKRCSECDSQASVLGIVSPSTANMLFIEVVREEYN